MGSVYPFEQKKLIVGVLTSRRQKEKELEALLTAQFGEYDYKSEYIPFDFTHYYDKEMGDSIFRLFYSFSRLIDPSRLPEIKLATNALEEMFVEEEMRKINLDPGLLCLSRLVLATTKDNAHRIPLSRGIYGEITLLFTRKGIQYQPWTYPDYRSPAYQKILEDIRALFKKNKSRDPV
jgi:hypothetical protein